MHYTTKRAHTKSGQSIYGQARGQVNECIRSNQTANDP